MLLQPIWSAYRAAAYGSGLLTIYNTTHARWHWNGFIRNNVNAAGYTDGEPEVRCIRDKPQRELGIFVLISNSNPRLFLLAIASSMSRTETVFGLNAWAWVRRSSRRRPST